MGMKKCLTRTLVGIGLGILANSYDKQTSGEFRFDNPVSIHLTLEEQLENISVKPYMVDTQYSLEFLGNKIPLKTMRSVTYPVTGKNFQGTLDKNGNIHTEEWIYKLQSNYDYYPQVHHWYTKE